MLSYFDLLAPIYDRIMGWLLGPSDRELWTELLKLPTDGRLLDAGGGTGRVSMLLRPMVGQLVISDISSGMLRQAGKKEGLDPVRSDAALLPFPNDTFERIMVVDALHHFPRQQEVIRELARVLAPGGLLVIKEFDIRRRPVKALALLERLILMGSRFPRPEEIGDRLLACGLRTKIQKGKPFCVLLIAEK